MFPNVTPQKNDRKTPGQGPKKPLLLLLSSATAATLVAGGGSIALGGQGVTPALGDAPRSPAAVAAVPGGVTASSAAPPRPTSRPEAGAGHKPDSTNGRKPEAGAGRKPEPTARRRPEAAGERTAEDRRSPKTRVPHSAKGRYSVVPGTAKPPKSRGGKVVRYIVEVEKGLPFEAEGFAAAVHRTLNDPRSWGKGGRMQFKRVSHGPVRFRVALSSPAMTNARCLPMRVLSELSCWNGGRAVINAKRWSVGIPGYRGDLAAYRQYVVNHEVGHALGHGHESCPGRGKRAPVMTQQTISLHGCRPNPWPFPRALDRAGKSPGR